MEVRAVLTVGVFLLFVTGSFNEALLPEDDNQTGVLETADNLPTPMNSEHNHVSESIQYKTAEIADAMQRSDIQTDPAVLLSMVPKAFKDLVPLEMLDGCEKETEEGECGASDSLDSTLYNQIEAKIQNIESDESNSTDSSKPLKVNCEDRNITGVENFTLNVLNASQDLMELLNPNSSECTMVLFFTPWCHFSAALAPHFNALPRAFPTLHFLALDASQHSSLSTRFGTVAVPNILLFQGAKPMARFNHTERTLASLKAFIFNQSGIEAKPDVIVTEADNEGPLPSTPQTGIDWLLVFSVLYVTAFVMYATMQTDRIRWFIPGQEHEHQE